MTLRQATHATIAAKWVIHCALIDARRKSGRKAQTYGRYAATRLIEACHAVILSRSRCGPG